MKQDKLKATARLLEIMDTLREQCPWDRKQTFETLRNNTIEETYELADAILNKDLDGIKEEAGDLLLHVVFYAKLGEEAGAFDYADVVNALCDKLVYRHPHIYGEVHADTPEEVKANWEALKLRKKNRRSGTLGGVPVSLPMMFYTAAVNGVFAFLIAGGLLFTTHGVTPEFLLNLLFYIIITPVISLTLTKIMYMSENKMVVADALQRIDSVLDAAPVPVSSKPQHPQDGSVTLRDVHFSYDGKTDVIRGVSMDILPGQTVAFVGPSGGGKSTLANLICRFFDVQSGSVRVGGADVRDVSKEELMDTISFVFQNSRLLKGSILDNVRLGKPQATEAEVLAALKAAQCMDIIEKFPAGIHTVIGTKGVYLSGGEQQRIAIARAMLKNAPILILDEATAFADPDNEAKVQAAFARLAKGKTVLMIAHRLSTVANADCIYVVQDGQIAEFGTKDELCTQNGLFARMWQEYQVSVQWKVAKEG